MKGKTISFIRSKNFKGLFVHIFKKYIINSIGLSLYSFIIPPIANFLTAASREIRINGLTEKLHPSDITDHLPTLFCEVVKARPKLVVELGTRGGDSTKALLKASCLVGAEMLSVDIDDCSTVMENSEFKSNWHFIQANDIIFAGEFQEWCKKNNFPESIDILFIDSSHKYDHTLHEIQAWFPFLSKKSKVIFHDTNMGAYFKHKNGRIAKGWDNRRGVIRAIEETLGRSYDETNPFIDWHGGWLVEHVPYSSGLTILTRANDG